MKLPSYIQNALLLVLLLHIVVFVFMLVDQNQSPAEEKQLIPLEHIEKSA
jgi:hypothetical protein